LASPLIGWTLMAIYDLIENGLIFYFQSKSFTMYIGIDFLISPDLQPYVVEVNLGLPGGAQEFDLTHLVYRGRPSGIFEQIEKTSRRIYGKGFAEYLASLPFIESLKPFKIWLDGQGPFPQTFHPGLLRGREWSLLKSFRPE